MTDKEFISGIIDDTYSENDIIKYCSGLYSVKAVWGVLMSEYSKFSDNCPVVSFENNATITSNDNLTIEQKRRLGRLLVAINIVEEMMQQQSNVETQPQITPKKKQQNNEIGTFQEFLNKVPECKRDKAQKYLNKAIELGLIDNNYKWTEGKELLSWFVSEFSLKCNMGKGVNSNGQPRTSWQPFETLFKITGLRSNFNDTQKTGRTPTKKELIDSVFV